MKQELTDKLLQHAMAEANRLNVAITASVVDAAGYLVAMYRQENCSYFGIEASRKKALTASQLKMPSHILNTISKQFPELQRSLNNNSDIELLPGGFPILLNEVVIGGLGISGGNFEQDQAIGEYALKHFEDLE